MAVKGQHEEKPWEARDPVAGGSASLRMAQERCYTVSARKAVGPEHARGRASVHFLGLLSDRS